MGKKPNNRPSKYNTKTRQATPEGVQLIRAAIEQGNQAEPEILKRVSQLAYASDGLPVRVKPAKYCSSSTFRRFQRGMSTRRFCEFCQALDLDPDVISGENNTIQFPPELAPRGNAVALLTPKQMCCIGRDRDLSTLESILRSRMVRRLYLQGARGFGKTTIADAIVRSPWVQAQFPQRVRVSLAAYESYGTRVVPRWRAHTSIASIEREIARACSPKGSETFHLSRDALYERLLAKPTLIVIDDLDCADDLDAVYGLILGLPDSVYTIATGTKPLMLDRTVCIEPLSKSASDRLIETRCQNLQVPIAPSEQAWLHDVTRGVPAAIVRAVALCIESGQWQRREIEQYSENCWTGYLELALEHLNDRAERVAAILGLFPQPVGLDVLAKIAAIDVADLPAIAARLRDLGLVDYDTAQATCVADRLTREQLRQCLEAHPHRQEIYRRWLDRYRRLAAEFAPDDWKVWQDYIAIEQEWENWLVPIEFCVAHGSYADLVAIWTGLRGYTNLRGYWEERLRWLSWAVDAADDSADL